MSRLSRYGRPYSLPLSEREIRRSLKLGLGRVRLHHQQYGLVLHREALFRACLENMVYDAQCEPSRAAWLLEIVDLDQQEELVRRISEAIPRTRRRQNLYQYCELCLLLAKNGCCSARSALYSAFRIDREGESIAANEIIDLDGTDGFVWLCQQVFSHGDLSEVERALGEFVSCYDFHHGKDEAETVVRQTLSLTALRRFFDSEPDPPVSAPHRGPQHSKKTVKKLTVADILELIDETNAHYYIQPVSLWSRSASQEQLEELAGVLAKEESVHRLRHILSVFCKRPLPLFEVHSDAFLRLATHNDWHVKRRANTALSTIIHPMIREMALAHLRSQEWLVGELTLLKSNLLPGDSADFAKHLKVDRNVTKHHRLICGLVEVCQANPWPELLEVMQFVYQTSPCTSCRRDIHKVMLEGNIVQEWIAAEWPFDVESMPE